MCGEWNETKRVVAASRSHLSKISMFLSNIEIFPNIKYIVLVLNPNDFSLLNNNERPRKKGKLKYKLLYVYNDYVREMRKSVVIGKFAGVPDE